MAAYPPFFIVAVPRSGTTLLRVMLERHPDVAIPGESHFIPFIYSRRRRYGMNGHLSNPEAFLRDLSAHRYFQRWDLPISAVRDELASLPTPTLSEGIAAAFRAYASRMGKPRWGDKTPEYVESLSVLTRLFPQGRIVHLIRDGRDVALSMQDLHRMHRRTATPAFFWARSITRARAAAAQLGPGRYIEMRYEDLLANPEAELRRLCAFLDLPFDAGMLQHDERAIEKLPADLRWMHSRLALPPTPGLRDWRRQMDRRAVAEFEAIARPALVAAGYPLATRPGVSIRARAWLHVGWFLVRTLIRRPAQRLGLLRGQGARARKRGASG